MRPTEGALRGVHALVQCDHDYTAAATAEPWPRFYARTLTRRYAR